MRSLFDPADCESLVRRLRSLTPQSTALWGRMTVHQMVCHVADQVRCSLGDIPTRPRRTLLRNRVARMLLVHLMPWPKGKLPTVREMQTSAPGEWERDLAATEALLRRAAGREPGAEWPEHPAFGPLSRREWGWLIYKHTDHHLRQFGA